MTPKVSFRANLWSLLRTQKGLLALVSVVALVAAALTIVPPLIIREILDQALPSQDMRALVVLSVALLVAGVFSRLFEFLTTFLAALVGNQLTFELSHRLFTSLQHKPLSFHANVASGEKINRLAQTFSIQATVSYVYVPLIGGLVILATSMVVMFLLDWRLALMAVGLLVPILALSTVVRRPVKELSARFLEQQTDILSFAMERLSRNGVIHVAALNLQDRGSQEFRQLGRPLVKLDVVRTVVGGLPSDLTSLASVVVMALAFGLGGYYVLQGSVSLGTVVAFTLLSSRILEPAAGLVRLPAALSETVADLERIFQYLEPSRPAVPLPSPKAELLPSAGRIEFRDVGFQYEADTPLLDNLSFCVGPNQFVSLVGINGSGKTTIAHLLIRLYEVHQGQIKLDGTDIRDLELSQLRTIVGFLPYDPLFFKGTIADNLRLGNPGASWEQIVKACRLARVDDVIAEIPESYNTFIGDGGYELSAGQKQRLALARLLVKDPQVILLDEFSAALDLESEQSLLTALAELAQSKTILALAHRLAVIEASDRVLVLEGGRIVEAGKLDDLAEAGGFYSQLVTNFAPKADNVPTMSEGLPLTFREPLK